MSQTLAWILSGATVLVLAAYEAMLGWRERTRPRHLAPAAHAALREDWFTAVSRHPGSEVLAVQTLRNSLMSATMTASTAVLALMGTVTLAAPTIHAKLADSAAVPSPRLALELMLMALLFASLVCSAMSMRYYNHAGFIAAMPVDSAARQQWSSTCVVYLRRAGWLYGRALRHLILVAPLVAAILHPGAGPVAAVVVVSVMHGFDRFREPGSA